MRSLKDTHSFCFFSLLAFGFISVLSGPSASANEEVLFGEDGRIEVVDSTAQQRTWARSVASEISLNALSPLADGSYRVSAPKSLADTENYCSDERFAAQPSLSSCSAVLISDQILLTAGHCVEDNYACASHYWVFDYEMVDATRARLDFEPSQVYTCAKILARSEDLRGVDSAMIQLDRKVEGRTPFTWRRDGVIANGSDLTVIGTPLGLPQKISTGGKVRENDRNSTFFGATIDGSPGNSGSPVINSLTGVLEGIFVRGYQDLVTVPDPKFAVTGKKTCLRQLRCSETGCQSQEVVRTTKILELNVSDTDRSLLNDLRRGYTTQARTLVTAGANAKIIDQFYTGNTAAHYAAIWSDGILMELVLKAGVDPNARNTQGFTALHIAIDHLDVDSVRSLMNHGMNAMQGTFWQRLNGLTDRGHARQKEKDLKNGTADDKKRISQIRALIG